RGRSRVRARTPRDRAQARTLRIRRPCGRRAIPVPNTGLALLRPVPRGLQGARRRREVGDGADSMNVSRGPTRIVLIRSGGYDYADLDLSGPVHLVAA